MDFQKMLDQVTSSIGGNVLGLLGALAILILGYLCAVFISSIFKSILNRLKVNERLSGVFPGTDVVSAAGTVVFYLLMVVVAVAFFQSLHLEQVTTPLNKLLETVFGYLPKLIAAGILILIAWCAAKIASVIVQKTLETAKIDAWFAPKSAVPELATAGEKKAFSNSIAGCVYGIVILLFLPSILETLGMTAALVPFNFMIAQIVGFLPNLLSAIVILIVGVFIARLVKQVVSGLLAAGGADALADRVGVGPALGKTKLSGLLGTVAYVLLLIPFVVAGLDALKMDAVSKPASTLLATMLGALPNLFGACLVLGIAYVIGSMISGLVANLLQGMGFDNVLVTLGLQKSVNEESRKPSHIAGSIMTAAIMMYAAVEAARLLGFNTIALQLSQLIVFCGHILMGLIVMGVGLFVSNFAANMIQNSGTANADLFASGVRIALIVLFAGMALQQMHIANDIINIGYASILGGIGLALAIGVGLSFGLGARDTAGVIAKDWHNSSKPLLLEARKDA